MSVLRKFSSFAFEYSTQRERDSRSIGLSFQRRVGSCEPLTETTLLLLVADREPVLDEDDPGPDEHPFELRAGPHELAVLVVRAEAHDPLDAGAVVPASVQQHHLAGRRQMGDVALEIPLGPFSLGRRRERDDTRDPRAHALGDPLDGAALAGRIAALEEHDDA